MAPNPKVERMLAPWPQTLGLYKQSLEHPGNLVADEVITITNQLTKALDALEACASERLIDLERSMVPGRLN